MVCRMNASCFVETFCITSLSRLQQVQAAKTVRFLQSNYKRVEQRKVDVFAQIGWFLGIGIVYRRNVCVRLFTMLRKNKKERREHIERKRCNLQIFGLRRLPIHRHTLHSANRMRIFGGNIRRAMMVLMRHGTTNIFVFMRNAFFVIVMMSLAATMLHNSLYTSVAAAGVATKEIYVHAGAAIND